MVCKREKYRRFGEAVRDLTEEICKQALSCGFDKCGIIPFSSLDGFDELFEKRLSDVPVSRYFYKNLEKLRDTRKRFPWAKSIVILVFDYGKFRFPKELWGKYAKAFFLEPEKKNDVV